MDAIARTAPADPSGAASREIRLALLFRRDPAADGRFWCSVITTRVYCRPTCPSRRARPEHIRFHDTLEEARRTGFRACRRCRPDEPSLEQRRRSLVRRACEEMARNRGATSKALARTLGVSPGHLHRVFRQVTGETPKARARRLLSGPAG